MEYDVVKSTWYACVCVYDRVTLDTPANRKGMPNANFSDWTPLEFVADTIHKWTEGQDRPANGDLLSLTTSEGVTTIGKEH